MSTYFDDLWAFYPLSPIMALLRKPQCGRSSLYPDWRSASRDYDAVHMTLQAIVATQGIYLRAGVRIVAPPSWDIESTLWLRWCFRGPELVDVIAS